MKLSSMRYKNYTWPHNPKTFVVEYRRQIAAQKVPMGGLHFAGSGRELPHSAGGRRICGAGRL